MSKKHVRQKTRRRAIAYWSEAAFLSFTEDLLEQLRKEGINQAELARRVGVSRGYLSRVFRGQENLSLETMSKLALGAGASVRLHVAPITRVTRWMDVTRIGEFAIELAAETAGTARRSMSAIPFANAGEIQAEIR
jgi:transcriptional regulator with XRE-family HTH domain